MKIIITESKLESMILKYINDKFDVNDINYIEFMDYDGNPDDSAYEFYLGDYGDDETVFLLYNEHYWGEDPSVKNKVEQSPILIIEDNTFVDIMNSVFGDKWEPVFKQWFDHHFGFEINKVM